MLKTNERKLAEIFVEIICTVKLPWNVWQQGKGRNACSGRCVQGYCCPSNSIVLPPMGPPCILLVCVVNTVPERVETCSVLLLGDRHVHAADAVFHRHQETRLSQSGRRQNVHAALLQGSIDVMFSKFLISDQH